MASYGDVPALGVGMQRTGDSSASTRVRTRPQFVIVFAGPAPDAQLLCLLWPDGDETRVVINETHGARAHDHAAYHHEQGIDGSMFVCTLDRPCGYDGDLGFVDGEDP